MAIIISFITFLFPLFFFPAITNPVFGAKNYFLAVTIVLILIFAGVRLISAIGGSRSPKDIGASGQKEELTYSLAPLDIFVILFFLANLVSWYFLPRGAKTRSLIQPLGLGSALLLTFFYFLITQSKAKEKLQNILYSLMASAVILSLISIVLFILPEGYSAGWVRYFNLIAFANPFILAQFLGLVSVFLISQIIKQINKEGEIKQLWMAVITVVILVGTGVTIYRAVEVKPALLDWFSSWATTVEAFKRNPLFGVGPRNFNTAFNRFRPREFNATENWNIRFGFSHSWFLQVWAELGIVGLAIVVLLLIRSLSTTQNKPLRRYFLLAVWLLLFLFPGNLIALFLLFLGLALARGKGKQKEFSLVVGEKGQNGAPIVIGGLLIVLGLVGGYYIYKLFLPEMTFYKAVKAVSENKGAQAYDLQRKAANQNRFIQTYRISFSQTNLALATNIIRQARNQNQQLTDQQRQQVQQLIAQVVNEAKAAVALEPRNVVGWENLAQIYRQLINMAQNADQWAISAYQQAIALDSLNPRVRVDYGGLLFGMGQFEEAAKQFEIGVNLKRDYTNAWYNWAHALKQQDKLQPAVERLQQAVNLVDRDSDDYEKVKAELEKWKKELGEEKPAVEEPTEEVTKPEPLPSPELEEPIELPEEAAPPLEEGTTVPEKIEEPVPTEGETLPSPSPQPTVTPQA